MRLLAFTILSAFGLDAYAQTVTLTGTNSASVTSVGGDYVTSGVTYASDGSTITISAVRSSYTELSSAVASANATTSGNSTSSPTQTLLVGGTQTTSTTLNGTASGNATSTTSSARPTNTVPCNGHPSYCARKYSNITMVAAHNSPFVRPGNAASNQELEVLTQLNDGIRMLQFQTHQVNDTMYLCHTSCDLLNAGTLEAYLAKVVGWLQDNPYDVVTILMGNSDVVKPQTYVDPLRSSGILEYVYTPPTVPMPLDSWPTLAEMIFTNQRVVMMLDYEADQTEIPWLLDEFSQMWETPFSPTDRDFPCTVQRPPDQSRATSEDRMFMANHNLNVLVAVAGISLDVPAYTVLNETNAVSGYGSAGAAVENCTAKWDRPPNFLLVDYYNLGNFNGSVFQVAATANGVSYDRSSCCGSNQRVINAAGWVRPSNSLGAVLVLIVSSVLLF